MNGWPLCAIARLYSQPETWSQILCRLYRSPGCKTSSYLLQKSFQWDYKLRSPMCIYMLAKRSHTHVKDPVVLSEFNGFWKHQNNPSCTKSVRLQSLHNVVAGHYLEEDGITCLRRFQTRSLQSVPNTCNLVYC